MSKSVSVIQTALTTTIQLELTYREHRPEFAVPDGNGDHPIGDYDFVAMSDFCSRRIWQAASMLVRSLGSRSRVRMP